jgi:hypothetical protein
MRVDHWTGSVPVNVLLCRLSTLRAVRALQLAGKEDEKLSLAKLTLVRVVTHFRESGRLPDSP